MCGRATITQSKMTDGLSAEVEGESEYTLCESSRNRFSRMDCLVSGLFLGNFCPSDSLSVWGTDVPSP
jgi:hypothetical protein